jgi:hypothetical protein
MSQRYGTEAPRAHANPEQHQEPARYLVVIDADGSTVARLFLATREQVAEFDAGAEEATQVTTVLVPTQGATGPEWDRALSGHSAQERAAAQVYTLAV